MCPLRRDRIEKIVATLIVVGGIGLRFAQYLGDRGLWGDEVAIALNLRTRGFALLFHPLSYDQTMPLGLLLSLKSLASVLGFSELVLRLPLLLAGCALLILLPVLYWNLFERRVLLLILALTAISEPLIYYSAEVKQYGLDALVAVVLVWLGITALRSEDEGKFPRLILGGTLALFFSQPSIIILASVSLAIAIDTRFRSSTRRRIYTFAGSALWLLIFATLYWLSYRVTSHSVFMRAFWADSFIRPSLSSVRDAVLFHLLGAAQIARVRASVLAILFLLGVYQIGRKQGPSIAVIASGPFVLLLMASALHQYPIAMRLVLFLVPNLLWIYASSISWIADLVVPSRFSLPAFCILSLLFIAPSSLVAIHGLRHFNQREATRDLARSIVARHDQSPTYLVFGHYMQWAYYVADWTHPEIWKPRVDTAYDCLRAAEIGYVQGIHARAPECVNLTYPPTPQDSEELVGNPPPGPKDGTPAEDRWAADEAVRIESIPTKSVWLFLPVYSVHFFTGFPKQRKLLEKLETQLDRHQCRLVESDSQGNSLALRYECSAHQADSVPPAPNG